MFLAFYIEKKPIKTIRTPVYKKRKKFEFSKGVSPSLSSTVWDHFNFDIDAQYNKKKDLETLKLKTMISVILLTSWNPL